MTKAWLFLLVLLVLLVLITPTLATGTSSAAYTAEGFIIEYPSIESIRVNEDFNFNFHVYNQTDGRSVNDGSTYCYFHLHNSSGEHIAVLDTNVVDHDYDYTFLINAGNFSDIGDYSYIISCNDSLIGGFYETSFFVTNAKLNAVDTSQAVFYSLLTLISVVLFIFLIFLALNLDGNNEYDIGGELLKINYKKYAKTGLYLLAYQVAVFISYAFYNIAELFLYSNVLLKFFDVVFWILLIGEIPFVSITVYFTLLKWFLDLELWELNERGLKER